METFVTLLAGAAVAAVVYLVASARRQARTRAWRAAAERNGLTGIEEATGGLFGGEFLASQVSGLGVRFERYQRGKYEHGTKITVTGLNHGRGGLSLRREGLGSAFEKHVIGEREIGTGDPSFDDACYVRGQAALVRAILDAETRRRLLQLLEGRVVVGAAIDDGALELRLKETGFSYDSERLVEVVAETLAVARRLVAPEDPAARIAANLRKEPLAEVRLHCLLTLARELPEHPATREALREALRDGSDEVRLRAAIGLGEEGHETLRALVSSEATEDSCAARAVAALGDRLSVEPAAAALRRALETGREAMARACLETLGGSGPEVEGVILEALRSREPQVSRAAARALGRAGTVAAVAALREATEPRGELPRSVGRQAIAEIQARLPGAGPGQLTLADAATGALSLADSEPGMLSLAGEDPEERAAPPGRAREPE